MTENTFFCSARYSIWPTSLFMDEEMQGISDEREDNKDGAFPNINSQKLCQKGCCPVFLPREKDFRSGNVMHQVTISEEVSKTAEKNSQDSVECCAIATSTVIRGMLLSYATNLKRPVVILERIPQSCKTYQNCLANKDDHCYAGCENMGKLIRLDSTAFYDRPMSACAWIRNTKGRAFCYAFDAAITCWFLEKAENGFKDEFGKDLGEDVKIPFKYQNKVDIIEAKFKTIEKDGMPSLRILIYTCPLSGYSETAVLIDCMGVYGVIIAGQTIFAGNDNVTIKNNFMSQVSDELYGAATWKSLSKTKQDLVEKVAFGRMKKQTTNEKDFLEKVETMADRFLSDLKLQYNRRVETRKRLLISRVAREFHTGVKNIIEKYKDPKNKHLGEPSQIENKKYEEIRQIFINMLCNRLPTEYGFPEPSVGDYLQFCFSDEEVEIIPKQLGKPLEFKRTNASPKGNTAVQGEVEIKQTAPHIFCYNYSTMQDIEESVAIKILNAVDLSGLCTGKKDDHRIVEIKQILENIFEHFERVAAQLLAEYHRKINATFTASMRHELGQIYDGNQMTLERYRARFDNDKRTIAQKIKQELSDDIEYLYEIESLHKTEDQTREIEDLKRKIECREREIRESFQEKDRQLKMENTAHLIRNFGGYMHASVMRVRSTKYMDIFPPPDPCWFFPYESFLWKWREIYDHIADRRQFQFTLHSPDNRYGLDPTRPRIFADEDQLEQVAYNLTNNAFKYARDGTVIDVDCRLCRKNENYRGCDSCEFTSDRYLLKVENYGFALPKKEQSLLGEYGFRGSNSPIGTDGTGLGIWYCRGIAESHNGHLILDYRTISQYDFTSMLIYNLLLSDRDKEKMFLQAKETWQIQQIEVLKDDILPPDPFPFESVSDMGEKIMNELNKMKTLSASSEQELDKKHEQENLIWNEKAQNFDVKNPQLNCGFAGLNVLRGTAKYTFGICLPIKYKNL